MSYIDLMFEGLDFSFLEWMQWVSKCTENLKTKTKSISRTKHINETTALEAMANKEESNGEKNSDC